MDNVKISVSFQLPGSVMDKSVDSKGNLQNYETVSIEISDRKGQKSETFKMKLPKCKPCTQTINMTDEAYEGMLSTPVKGMSPNHWKRMSVNQRVAEHLKEIQFDLHATSFEFTIYDD